MAAIFAKLGIVFVSGAMAVGTFFVSSAFVVFHHGGRYDPCRHDGSTLHDRDAFIYGGALTLDVECYVADRIALLANLRERCLWGGDTQMCIRDRSAYAQKTRSRPP